MHSHDRIPSTDDGDSRGDDLGTACEPDEVDAGSDRGPPGEVHDVPPRTQLTHFHGCHAPPAHVEESELGRGVARQAERHVQPVTARRIRENTTQREISAACSVVHAGGRGAESEGGVPGSPEAMT